MPESWDLITIRGRVEEVEEKQALALRSLAGHLELADAVSGAVNVTGTFLGGDESSSRPLKKSYNKPRQCIKKQRHHFAHKGPYSQSYVCMEVRVGL